jgi:hypothetical protein
VKKPEKYATEAALCADFIAWVKRDGREYRTGEKPVAWTVYAETAGWDILLVGPDGTQIGIEAKLRFNMKVLQQCLPDTWDGWHDQGPDYRAVLVPDWSSDDARVCNALGLALLGRNGSGWREASFRPGLLENESGGGWHYWSPRERCKLPEFVPDVAAGCPAPLRLTQWKVAALRITATLEVRGHVTRQDFREYSIDPRRWTGPGGWLLPGAVPGQFVRAPALDFDKQHPEVYAQVLAEVREKQAKRDAPLVPETLL